MLGGSPSPSSPAALMRSLTGRHSTSQRFRNKFVETALAYALTYVWSLDISQIGAASVTILADSDYYSHPGLADRSILSTTERFIDFGVPLHEAHKTGLGSSAALVTAFVAAIVAHYVPKERVEVTSTGGRLRLHNLAQAAHCAAQGKVGSGFDVAAAVYGSCVYRRFSPSILGGIGDIGSKGFGGRLKSVVDNSNLPTKWDMEIDKTSAALPTGLRLLMCDVDCGSETVGMVKSVLAWRKERPEQANRLWAALQRANEDLVAELMVLQSESKEVRRNLERIRAIILTIRTMVREMSKQAGVPIEPVVQTALIDSCCNLDGVIGGIVPGAGGYDAIALLVEDRVDVINNLSHHVESYRVGTDSSQGPRMGNIRLLSVKQDDQGVKQENPSTYSKWTWKSG